ncbi:hypothetical protein PIB30_056483 [Stylosanthes scabra]|uniref:Uncharacterized protein n=1 Tax=Stylosanthes scabra TaxID=79078 RepID=A0ABU6SL32_9FABA|nr:hypothetical protein [Stylosanthes scabra]
MAIDVLERRSAATIVELLVGLGVNNGKVVGRTSTALQSGLEVGVGEDVGTASGSAILVFRPNRGARHDDRPIREALKRKASEEEGAVRVTEVTVR